MLVCSINVESLLLFFFAIYFTLLQMRKRNVVLMVFIVSNDWRRYDDKAITFESLWRIQRFSAAAPKSSVCNSINVCKVAKSFWFWTPNRCNTLHSKYQIIVYSFEFFPFLVCNPHWENSPTFPLFFRRFSLSCIRSFLPAPPPLLLLLLIWKLCESFWRNGFYHHRLL